LATEKQMAANRRNAAKSTGPRTAAGKARSRMNAYRHGFSSKLRIEETLDGEGVTAEASRNNNCERLEIALHSWLHRVQLERVKILSNLRAGFEDPMQLNVALQKVAALKRYEGRIFADCKRSSASEINDS
jgi:hypothetical protein